ncbi:MAG: MlaD family protein, partial [Chitinophagaceae bacterium]
MKLSNETKIGALALVSIILLFLGYNFLKGRNVFKERENLYAVFEKVDALNSSDAVKMNGLQIGVVKDLQEKDQDLSGVIVTINLNRNVRIPKNSFAVISSNPLGATFINIVKGEGKDFLKEGDTLLTVPSSGLFDDIKGTLNPAMTIITGTVKSLDSLIEVIGAVFDPKTRSNLQNVIGNLNNSTSNLNQMLAPGSDLAKTVANLNSVTTNFKNNNESINKTLNHLESFSNNLSQSDIKLLIANLQKTTDLLNNTLVDINKGEGSAGLLLHDQKLYNNLNASANSLNILLQDLRLHPKRYVNISVFGGKT